jgi:hypothetical protein
LAATGSSVRSKLQATLVRSDAQASASPQPKIAPLPSATARKAATTNPASSPAAITVAVATGWRARTGRSLRIVNTSPSNVDTIEKR